jgi:hypothetical protein
MSKTDKKIRRPSQVKWERDAHTEVMRLLADVRDNEICAASRINDSGDTPQRNR